MTTPAGVLGYVSMVSSNLATNPYGLAAVICIYTFLVSGHSHEPSAVDSSA